jgi:hypothetical protein
VLFVSETYRMDVDGKWFGAEYSPSSKTYTYRALGSHSAALRHELSLTATVVSADVEEHSLLGGYRKTFQDTVSDTFSIVEDVPRGSIRVSGPSKAKVNRRFSLTAEIVGATVPSSRLAVGWARSGGASAARRASPPPRPGPAPTPISPSSSRSRGAST